MPSNVQSAIELLTTTIELTSKNKTILDLASSIGDVSKKLEILKDDYFDQFDIHIKVIDPHTNSCVLEIPSNKNDTIPIILSANDFSLQMLQDLLSLKIKASDIAKRIALTKQPLFTDLSLDFLVNSEYPDTWDSLRERVGYKETSRILPTKILEEIEEIYQNSNLAICCNASCTGKTWLGIIALDREFPIKKKYVCNFGSRQFLDYSSLFFLLQYGSDCCILIDDIQCDTETATLLLKFLKENYRSIKERDIFVFIISWPNILEDTTIGGLLKDIQQTKTDPGEYVDLLSRRLSQTARDVCNNNLSLMTKASILQQGGEGKNRRNLTVDELKEKLFNCFVKASDHNQVFLAYVCAVLGVYEYETPCAFLDSFRKGKLNPETLIYAKTFSSVISSTSKKQLSHPSSQNYIFVAHRRTCEFIAEYIESKKTQFNLQITRKDILVKYIHFLDGTLKWKALINIVGSEKKSEVYATGFIWNLLNELIDYLRIESKKDPTWKQTPSSMFFVLKIAEYLNVTSDEEFSKVIQSFADCFFLESGHLQAKFEIIQTRYDFEQIQKCMIDEDEANGEVNYESGQDLDKELMHSNWLLSLVVGLTQILNRFGFEELARTALGDLLSRQLPDGSWYPSRVPWVTGCVLRSLGTIGFDSSSEIIQKAEAYLANKQEEDGCWIAHTGAWNKAYETTSICLDGLYKCKCSKRPNVDISSAVSYLKSESQEWMQPGKEIDGSASACLLMNVDRLEGKLLDYIKNLANNNIETILERGDDDKKDFDLQTETCKSAMICYYIIDLCWNVLERDLQGLMEEFIYDSYETEAKPQATGNSVNIGTINGPVQIVHDGDGYQMIMPKDINSG